MSIQPTVRALPMKFFNFTNSETYHFFQWLCHTDEVAVDQLVKRAIDEVEGDAFFELGADVSSVAREKLVEILEELIVDIRSACWTKHQLHLEQGIGESDALSYSGYGTLFGPLLCEALGQVSLPATAKALLIRSGKWAPDREPPSPAAGQ